MRFISIERYTIIPVGIERWMPEIEMKGWAKLVGRDIAKQRLACGLTQEWDLLYGA